jgi:hypothetical protein
MGIENKFRILPAIQKTRQENEMKMIKTREVAENIICARGIIEVAHKEREFNAKSEVNRRTAWRVILRDPDTIEGRIFARAVTTRAGRNMREEPLGPQVLAETAEIAGDVMLSDDFESWIQIHNIIYVPLEDEDPREVLAQRYSSAQEVAMELLDFLGPRDFRKIVRVAMVEKHM